MGADARPTRAQDRARLYSAQLRNNYEVAQIRVALGLVLASAVRPRPQVKCASRVAFYDSFAFQSILGIVIVPLSVHCVSRAIRLCPESFSACLGSSSTCALVLLRATPFLVSLGSCALAWAVKEVPDSEAGPPAPELPRQTDIDPFSQGEARKARARSRKLQYRFGGVRLHFSPIRRVGSAISRSNRRGRSPAKRLRRWELTLSWIGRPWVLRGSHRGRGTPTDRCEARCRFRTAR